jgi:type I restriction enzyme S subunit
MLELFNDVPQDWELTTLGEICERGGGSIQTGPFGSQLHASDYVPVGIPSIMPADIIDNRINTKSIAMISEKDAERLSRHRVKVGNIVFSRRGDVTRRALVRKEQDGWLCGTGSLKIDLGRNVVDSLYAYLYLGNPEVKDWILRHAVGSTMPNLNSKIMASVPFLLPPLPEQRAISHILGALDDKIDLNRRMNNTLEAIAQAIFKSWFVDFDPVVAKSEGRQPYGMNEKSAALFPAEFVDSELGAIPKGWRVGTVGGVFDLTMGQSPPGISYNEIGEGSVFYQGRTDFGARYPTPRVYCTAPTRFAKPGDTLISVRAPVGDINMALESCSIGRGLASIQHKSGSRSYTYYAMHFMKDDFDVFEGEGTLFGSISGASFRGIKIVVLPPEVIAEFEHRTSPLDQVIENNARQIFTLASIRDTLLPRLLSGEVRVKGVALWWTQKVGQKIGVA